MREDAAHAGISAKTIDAAFNGLQPDTKVLDLQKQQPEFKTPVWDYVDGLVEEDRVAEGKAAMARESRALARAEETYGVSRYMLAATLIFVVLYWIGSRLEDIWRRRRAAYEQSEPFIFDKARKALSGNNAGAAYNALEQWTHRLGFGSVDVNQNAVSVFGSMFTPVSSRTSRAPPCAHVSWSSRKPPVRASLPICGSMARRIVRRPVRPSFATGTRTTETGMGFDQICVLHDAHVRG